MRGKREGPSGRRLAFSWARGRAVSVRGRCLAPLPSRLAHRLSALATGAGHDRFAVGLSPRAKVAPAPAGVLQRAGGAARRRIEERMPRALCVRPSPFGWLVVRRHCTQCRCRAGCRFGGAPSTRSGSVATSATLPTRLETRTKESNMSASRRVVRDSQAK